MKKLLWLLILSSPALAQVFPPGGGGSGSSADTRPRATSSVVGVTVAASGSCVLSVSPGAGGQQTINACNTGTPVGSGTMTHLHLTLGANGDNTYILQNSTVTFLCDSTSQTVPLSLFLLTQDTPIPFSNDWIQNSLGGNNGSFSGNRRMENNFTTGCTVTFHNASAVSSVVLFSEVDYRLGANVSRASRQYWHAFVQPLTPLAAYANLNMLNPVRDAAGGELESTTLFGMAPTNGGWEEGYTTVTVDGNTAVTANGTEDFFGSGYNGVNTIGGHQSPKWGEFYGTGWTGTAGLLNQTQDWDAVFYRNFQTDNSDNALFTTTLAAYSPNGENGKPGASNPGPSNQFSSMVTFWTHDPMVQTPTLSPAGGPGVTSGTISSTTTGATFCWTSDGSTPTSNGAGTCTHGNSGSTFTVTPPQTIQAVATKASMADSFVATGAFQATYSAPTYRQSCNGSTGGTPASTITCTMTPTAGDFIYVSCTKAATKGSLSVTSSQSQNFIPLPPLNGVNGQIEGFYLNGATGAATTFTCTSGPSSSAGGYFGITALDYAPGSITTAVASAGNNIVASNATYTSQSISTTGAAFYIVCGHADYGPPTPTAGTINGSAATGRTMTSSIPSYCEDLSVASSATNAVGTITGSTSGFWDGTIVAFQ